VIVEAEEYVAILPVFLEKSCLKRMAGSQSLDKLMQYALGDDDLRTLLGNDVKIITYPELGKESLGDLLGPGGHTLLLFLTEDKTHGHWLTVLGQDGGKKIEVFDSFGTPIDGDRAWLDQNKLSSLHETLPLLGDILKAAQEEGIQVVHNTTKLQGDHADTCGRHVAVRLLNKELPIEEYVKRLKGQGNPDEVVTKITYNLLGK